MAGTMGPLIEYLLAYKRPGGGDLVRFGGGLLEIPIFPAGFTLSLESRPNGFANILYFNRISPEVVPGAFTVATYQAGIQVSVGTVGGILTEEGYNVWIEYRRDAPLRTVTINVSGLNQYFSAEAAWIEIATEEDYKRVREIIDSMYSNLGVEKHLDKTNEALASLAEKMGRR